MERAQAVTEFLDCYYKADRLNREAGTRQRIIEDRLADLKQNGEAFISRHDSMTGRAVKLIEDPRTGLFQAKQA